MKRVPLVNFKTRIIDKDLNELNVDLFLINDQKKL